jgi:hypothetical protein
MTAPMSPNRIVSEINRRFNFMSENTKTYFHIQEDEWAITAESTDSSDAHVVIRKNGETVKEFSWPAYKVWNLAAYVHRVFAGLGPQGLEETFITNKPDAGRAAAVQGTDPR